MMQKILLDYNVNEDEWNYDKDNYNNNDNYSKDDNSDNRNKEYEVDRNNYYVNTKKRKKIYMIIMRMVSKMIMIATQFCTVCIGSTSMFWHSHS